MSRHYDSRFLFMRDDIRAKLPVPDLPYLASLEQPGIPTIHNMIMGDPLVSALDYHDALTYASYLARRMEVVFQQVRPSMILGGFDGVHGGIGLAVARRLGIPWFALNFTTIPFGMSGFCTGMSPGTSFSCLAASPESLHSLADRTVSEFEGKRIVVPAYLSANSLSLVLKRLPRHFGVLSRIVGRLFTRQADRFTQYSVGRLFRQYVRKRLNLIRLPKPWLIETPPSSPFLFIGLHMQPESSIDVWAPFFADQFAVIESIARSAPPTHQLLVKLHKSDADHYSPAQLNRLRRLPGVQLVSPYANSRAFIEQGDLILAIQGNIALEAALLGRPVLLFGDSRFLEFPSVSRVKRATDLPDQIRQALAEPRPSREAIIRGMAAYLSFYAPGCYNDWDTPPSPDEIAALANHFRALRALVEQQSQSRCAE